ncbi:unnamed protein product, partial [Cuscuta campestris]
MIPYLKLIIQIPLGIGCEN